MRDATIASLVIIAASVVSIVLSVASCSLSMETIRILSALGRR